MAEYPTIAELKQLSLRGIVAYAERCARGAQPNYVPNDELDEEQKGRHVASIERAILAAQLFHPIANLFLNDLAIDAIRAIGRDVIGNRDCRARNGILTFDGVGYIINKWDRNLDDGFDGYGPLGFVAFK